MSVNTLGVVIFGLYFAYSGLAHFLGAKGLIGYASFKKVPMPSLAVYGTGLLMLLGGLGVTFGIYREVALGMIALFLVPTTVFMHDFWNESDPSAKMNGKIAFLKNVALLGATLALF